MMIFGTIGLFRKFIDLPSSFLAMARGIIGSLFLIVFLVCRKAAKRSEHVLDITAIRPNLWLLFLSGAMIGFNWILLFEAYRYTTVAVATLCYYLAPTIMTLAAVPILKEKLTAKTLVCTIVALGGMALVSGVVGGSFSGGTELLGSQFRLINGFGADYGFDGVAMALIGQLHPIATMVVAIFFAALRAGSTDMQAATGVPTSVSDIIQALVIVFSVAGMALVKLPEFVAFKNKYLTRKSKKEAVAKRPGFPA